MRKGPIILLGTTVIALVTGFALIPSLLGYGNVGETACEVCDHRLMAFNSTGLLLPVGASSLAGLLLGSLLFWKPERPSEEITDTTPDRFCTNCGKGIEIDWHLCPFCGQSVLPLHLDPTETRQ